LANLVRGCRAVAGPRHVAKITIYVTGHRHEYLPAIDAAGRGPFAGYDRQMPVNRARGTAVVAALGRRR